MKSSILLVLLFVDFSSAVQITSPDNLHQQGRKQTAVKEHSANQQRKMVEFLSAFDKVQKITKTKLLPKTSDLQVYAKMFGKTVKMEELDDSQFSPISHEEAIVDFLEINPLSGKHFRKATPLSSKKSKKRACFWKYCVQRK